MLHVTERTVTSYFNTGIIPATRIGPKLWRTRREIIDAYLVERLGPVPSRRPEEMLPRRPPGLARAA